jgi:hypothetical protein
MVHGISSRLAFVNSLHGTPRKSPQSYPAANGTTATGISATVTSAAGSPAAPDWRALFAPKVTPVTTGPQPPSPPPTAESVFGPNPWVSNPTGQGPGGNVYSYNPYYFATPQTAAKVAQMVGGTVVQSNAFTPNGGPFAQTQPNQMVQLPDGRMINPGLVASFYTHGYPQSYIDQLIAKEVGNT